MSESIGPIHKIDSYKIVTASGDIWIVTLLGDKTTNGQRYCEAHIKDKNSRVMLQEPLENILKQMREMSNER